jgi:hypothetical protein
MEWIAQEGTAIALGVTATRCVAPRADQTSCSVASYLFQHPVTSELRFFVRVLPAFGQKLIVSFHKRQSACVPNPVAVA